MLKVEVLFLAANPQLTGPLALDEEIHLIERKMHSSKNADALVFRSSGAARPDDLLLLLNQRRPQIIHFSGHNTSSGILMVGDDGYPKLVSAQALKYLFSTLKNEVRLIVLNACYSNEQAEALKDVIDCVIGMNDRIGDKAAAVFAASFYRAIAFGRSIREAFDQGLASLMLEGISEEDIPQLHVKNGVDATKIRFIELPDPKPVNIFVSYDHHDRVLRDQLASHLANLRNQGLIRDWYDDGILAGSETEKERQKLFDAAQIFLLLISANYMSSAICYSVDMRQALDRDKAGTASVIPVLSKPCDYEGAPFAGLRMLPSNKVPITRWADREEAFADIIKGIRERVKEISARSH